MPRGPLTVVASGWLVDSGPALPCPSPAPAARNIGQADGVIGPMNALRSVARTVLPTAAMAAAAIAVVLGLLPAILGAAAGP